MRLPASYRTGPTSTACRRRYVSSSHPIVHRRSITGGRTKRPPYKRCCSIRSRRCSSPIPARSLSSRSTLSTRACSSLDVDGANVVFGTGDLGSYPLNESRWVTTRDVDNARFSQTLDGLTQTDGNARRCAAGPDHHARHRRYHPGPLRAGEDPVRTAITSTRSWSSALGCAKPTSPLAALTRRSPTSVHRCPASTRSILQGHPLPSKVSRSAASISSRTRRITHSTAGRSARAAPTPCSRQRRTCARRVSRRPAPAPTSRTRASLSS